MAVRLESARRGENMFQSIWLYDVDAFIHLLRLIKLFYSERISSRISDAFPSAPLLGNVFNDSREKRSACRRNLFVLFVVNHRISGSS